MYSRSEGRLALGSVLKPGQSGGGGWAELDWTTRRYVEEQDGAEQVCH